MTQHRPSSIKLKVRQEAGVLVETYEYTDGTVEPLGWHVHPTWQLAWSPDAVGEHWVRDSMHTIPPGAIGIIPPGEVHAPSQQTRLEAPASFMMAYLDESVLAEVASELRGGGRGTPSFAGGVIHGDPRLSLLFARAQASSFGGDPLERDVAWIEFLSRLLTGHADSRLNAPRVGREPRAVAAALEVLHGRPHERITLKELARTANVTPARLCRTFARQVGLPPHAYQLRMRIEHAKQLLLRGHRVADVAAATGFADQSHFGRHFKRVVGTTPSTYMSARR